MPGEQETVLATLCAHSLESNEPSHPTLPQCLFVLSFPSLKKEKKKEGHMHQDLFICPRDSDIESKRARCAPLIIFQLGQNVLEEKKDVCGVDQD